MTKMTLFVRMRDISAFLKVFFPHSTTDHPYPQKVTVILRPDGKYLASTGDLLPLLAAKARARNVQWTFMGTKMLKHHANWRYRALQKCPFKEYDKPSTSQLCHTLNNAFRCLGRNFFRDVEASFFSSISYVRRSDVEGLGENWTCRINVGKRQGKLTADEQRSLRSCCEVLEVLPLPPLPRFGWWRPELSLDVKVSFLGSVGYLTDRVRRWWIA